jgi:hypothetical protein
VASAAPIALIANVLRITTTGFLHQTVGGETANAFFHDLAGWLMMPLALALLWVELWVLDHLLIEPATPRPVRLETVLPRGGRPTAPARPQPPATGQPAAARPTVRRMVTPYRRG